jgi:hypothetical protein
MAAIDGEIDDILRIFQSSKARYVVYRCFLEYIHLADVGCESTINRKPGMWLVDEQIISPGRRKYFSGSVDAKN